MPMTVQDVFEIDTTPSGASGAAEAKLREARAAVNRGGMVGTDRTAGYGNAQLSWLRGLKKGATGRKPLTRVRHPSDRASYGLNRGRMGAAEAERRYGPQIDGRPQKRELTGSELAWLERLPSDPRAVTFEQAEQLATLVQLVDASANPASRTLVDSLWEPVRLVHDELVARDELRRLAEPLPVSAAAINAVTEILQRDTPGLDEDLARGTAQSRAREFTASASGQYERTKAKLERNLNAILARKRERAETTRTSIS